MRRSFALAVLPLAFMVALALTAVAMAVEPGEMLGDPALESRARTVSEGLRCLVCQNESIDDSHAELAKDIRLLVRQRLQAGDSNQAVRDFLVARYGQFILLRPPLEAQTLLLWGMPVLVLVGGSIGILLTRRRGRAERDPSQPLSQAERLRLEKLLQG